MQLDLDIIQNVDEHLLCDESGESGKEIISHFQAMREQIRT